MLRNPRESLIAHDAERPGFHAILVAFCLSQLYYLTGSF